MRIANRALLILIAGTLLSSSVWAQRKAPKKPLSVYLTTARIEIVEGRNDSAIGYLEQLLDYYGPHAEALYLMGQIQVDFIETASGPMAKAPYVHQMVLYFDSLQWTCANKEIKKKYRNDCKKYIMITDSLRIKYWREFFNAGLQQLGFAEELQADIEAITDSSSRLHMQDDITANIDSCIENMQLCVTTISDSARPYLILDKAYGLKQEYQSGIDWLLKGLDKSEDPSTVLLSLAYDYIQLDDYCGAIPHYRRYLETDPVNLTVMSNLAICYNRCDKFDSALIVYRDILANDPENVSVLFNVGLYFNTLAQAAADSVAGYQQESNDEATQSWNLKKQAAFDSSRVYFGKAFELNPDDPGAAEQYALASALLGKYEEAARGFARVTELRPERADAWTSLGDCRLSLRQFDQAVAAYEKVVELKPDAYRVWEHLADLYVETGQSDKKAAADKKLKELRP